MAHGTASSEQALSSGSGHVSEAVLLVSLIPSTSFLCSFVRYAHQCPLQKNYPASSQVLQVGPIATQSITTAVPQVTILSRSSSLRNILVLLLVAFASPTPRPAVESSSLALFHAFSMVCPLKYQNSRFSSRCLMSGNVACNIDFG